MKVPFAFSCSILLIALAYRGQLTYSLFTHTVRPFDFNPSIHSVWEMVKYLPYDLGLALLCFGGSWFIQWVFHPIMKRGRRTSFSVAGIVLLHLFLLSLLLVHGAHLRLLFETQTGMSYFVLQEVLLNVPKTELLKFVDWKDGLFLLLPNALFWGILFLPSGLRVKLFKTIAGAFLILFALSGIGLALWSPPLPPELRLNPALFFLSDLAEEIRGDALGEENFLRPQGGMGFRETIPPLNILPPKADHRWNIVLFIMESVGSRYIFDANQTGRMPMPFLHSLIRESWHLKRHYTTSNISTKAIFSLLSGRYDLFSQEMFGTRQEVVVPSLQAYLPEDYETFMVTPSPLQWYFPVAFVRNNGLREVYHFENLNLKKREEKNSFGRYLGRDEVETIDFFIQRVRKAKEPFLAIYLSFAAHLPYFDYGPEYRISSPDNRMISRYYNNLHLLDHMLKRVYETLKMGGLLERTIFIIAGDHGQAFGQHHPDNFMHHRYSYNENLETPLIFHQPALFRPRSVEVPTSHVDLLPTLLDAMRISYSRESFDGESLFHPRLGRKYIFVYGYEGTLTSIDSQLTKVQYSLKKKRCWAFDQKSDPEEKIPLDCSPYEPQLEALRTFAIQHNLALVRDNERIREERGLPKALASPAEIGRKETLVEIVSVE